MQNTTTLAEMVNRANYASMSYNELVTINMAFHLALVQVKPFIEKKRAEEIAAHTHEYVAIMNNYGTSKAEILACLEREVLRETPYGPLAPQDVDDQSPNAVPGEDTWKEQAHKETILLLPEHVESMVDDARDQVITESADAEERPMEEAQESQEAVSVDTKCDSFVEQAMGIMKTLPIPEGVNPNEPYYMECDFRYEEELGHSDPSGRNMRRADLEEFRSASEVYYRIFMKKRIIESTEDCLAYNDDLNTLKVRLYHFPEDTGNAVDVPAQEAVTLTEDEAKELKKKKSYLKKAIKQAKEYSYSDGTDAHTPFYDTYKFTVSSGKQIKLKRERVRVYEDITTLTELMPAFESYARLFQEGFTVMVQDNCLAGMMSHEIYVVQFNIPTPEKKRKASKKTDPVTKEACVKKDAKVATDVSPAQGERDLILNAVEMTRALPVVKGTDINLPYFIQSSFSIADGGNLFYSGKPFSRNVSVDELNKYRQNHNKYAKALKASHIVSNDGYTAFIWNDGKSLIVFDYNVDVEHAA